MQTAKPSHYRTVLLQVQDAMFYHTPLPHAVSAAAPPTMLQMVAMPVADRDSVPGPWYSTMAPVPPFTDRMPATCAPFPKTGCACA